MLHIQSGPVLLVPETSHFLFFLWIWQSHISQASLWSCDKFTTAQRWSEVKHTPFVPFILKMTLFLHSHHCCLPHKLHDAQEHCSAEPWSKWSHKMEGLGLWITTWRRATYQLGTPVSAWSLRQKLTSVTLEASMFVCMLVTAARSTLAFAFCSQRTVWTGLVTFKNDFKSSIDT